MLTQEKKYSVDEVAKEIGVSKRTIERFIKKGELKYYRFGSRIIISESQLNTFAEKKRMKFFWMSDDLDDLTFDLY